MVEDVSIHAPWEGCDSYLCDKYGLHSKFQFTHPGKGATRVQGLYPAGYQFQFTHPGKGATYLCSWYFLVPTAFQFTHPGKGATTAFRLSKRVYKFQFTHPGKGATCCTRASSSQGSCFNSRTLGRVRLDVIRGVVPELSVSIHAPWEGCDWM